LLIVTITIIILVFIIITLMIYNMSIHKKVATFNNINEKINGLNVLQNFMDTIGEYNSVDEKLNKINEIIIEKYSILKYSTIVVFDGAEYKLKASNVDDKHWESLTNLYNEEIFKDSIQTAIPKYVTVKNQNERLPYQKMEFGRAKSAMFFPLYIDNVYIGYWLIESGVMQAFENIDTAIIEVIKDNIVTILKTIEYQKTVENIVRKDQFTNLNSAEYLYGEGKKIVDRYTISTVCMFRIVNIEKINEISRKLGNEVIIEVSKLVENSISREYLFVRYMGPKFALVFSGVLPEDAENFITSIKDKLEKLEISLEGIVSKKTKKEIVVLPKINFAITSYYKGTSMDGVTKKLEEYIDNANKAECDINYI